jgi:hypothetical protein
MSPRCFSDTSSVAAAAVGAQDKSVVLVWQEEMADVQEAVEAQIQRVQFAVRHTAAVNGEAFDIRCGVYWLAHLVAAGARQELSLRIGRVIGSVLATV